MMISSLSSAHATTPRFGAGLVFRNIPVKDKTPEEIRRFCLDLLKEHRDLAKYTSDMGLVEAITTKGGCNDVLLPQNLQLNGKKQRNQLIKRGPTFVLLNGQSSVSYEQAQQSGEDLFKALNGVIMRQNKTVKPENILIINFPAITRKKGTRRANGGRRIATGPRVTGMGAAKDYVTDVMKSLFPGKS